LRSSMTLYATRASVPWATLGLRVGGEHLVGAFPFYDAATLGGTTNLRGYRAHRFAGRSTFFAGAEPRIRLNRFRAVLWPAGEFGVLAFADAGRVWADGMPKGPWHVGYGAGVWGALSSRLGGTLTYDVSQETRAVSLRFGFAF
ncbi:MAG TPA: BamA/TamA family outer membrane protein, partial [Rhodothermales bacterium]|nr:BamA/TamA family outer membrane protein [Rhodothermales bacterium]